MTGRPSLAAVRLGPLRWTGPAILELARLARSGDIHAMRALHFGPSWDAGRPPGGWFTTALAAARAELEAETEADKTRRRRPRSVQGRIDFFRIHALALDRLAEVIAVILPIGEEGPSARGRWCWRGHHPNRPAVVQVCLLAGAWYEPDSGRGGVDLVSLYSHMFGVKNSRAAAMLADLLDCDLVSDV
jgi:hypothetical protein